MTMLLIDAKSMEELVWWMQDGWAINLAGGRRNLWAAALLASWGAWRPADALPADG